MKLNLIASLKTQNTQESIVFTIGLILRCWFFDRAPFWYDEGFSAVMARLPIANILQATAGDVHPPLYYLLLSGWAQLFHGFSPYILRQPSVILAILSMWQVLRLCQRYQLGRVFRLAVLGLVACSPMLIYYAQETRMYALLVCLVLEIWIQILDRRWWAIGILTTALLYTHNYGLIYGASLGMLALLHALKRPRAIYRAGDSELKGTDIPPVLISFGVPVLLYIPWFIYGLAGQLGTVGANFWTRHIGTMGNLLGTTSLLMGSKVPAWIAISIFAVLIGTLPFVIWTALKAKRLDWVVMAMAPICLTALISLWKPIYLVRGLLACLPAWYLLLVLMLKQTIQKPSLLKAGLLFIVLIALFTGMYTHIGTTYMGLQKYNPLAFNTQVTIKPGVPVIHLGDFSLINWMASRPYEDNQLYLSPCDPLPGELSPSTRAAMGVITLQPDQLPAEYYLIPYVGNLSNRCQEDQYHRLTQGLTMIYQDVWQYGDGGVYYHAKQ
jgi:mannosyltransferase